MEKRYIGIDLHRNRFTCCIRLENERTYVTEWELEDLGRFVKKLRRSDEIAVEITGNTRLFYDAVAPHVARGGSQHEPVQGDSPVSEEDRSARRTSASAVLVEEHAAGGTHEG
jgi:hypothetical protein